MQKGSAKLEMLSEERKSIASYQCMPNKLQKIDSSKGEYVKIAQMQILFSL